MGGDGYWIPEALERKLPRRILTVVKPDGFSIAMVLQPRGDIIINEGFVGFRDESGNIRIFTGDPSHKLLFDEVNS
jgi:hypothetical protein